MPRKMTYREIEARIEAYEECCRHLEMIWTDDPVEKDQGRELAKVLTTQQNQWIDRLITHKRIFGESS